MSGRVGFIGPGVVGESMCRNLALKSGAPVIAYDRDPASLARFAAHGVIAVVSVTANSSFQWRVV